MKFIKKIINFVVMHPIWSMIITGAVISFITGYKTHEWNFAGSYILTFFIFAFLAPFIRNARRKIEKKEEIDYMAKRIAEEQNKYTK